MNAPGLNAISPAALSLLQALQAVSSHHINYPVPQAAGLLFFDLCILRDPIDRLESMYGYFREKPAEGNPLSALARQSTLGEYFAHLTERAPFYLNDNLAAKGEWDHPPNRVDLDRATRRIATASFPGVVDRLDESLVASEYALKPAEL